MPKYAVESSDPMDHTQTPPRDDQVRVFRLEMDDGSVSAHGTEYPTGTCYIEWKTDSFPEHRRLENSHGSRYGSIEDVEKATSLNIVFVGKLTVE